MQNQNGGLPQEPTKVDNSNLTITSNETTTQPIDDKLATTPAELPKTEEKKSLALTDNVIKEQESEAKYWQDDWREKMSGGDEKVLKMLQKYKNPSEAAKGQRELEAQFHKTRPLPELPKDATPEQIAEYREKAGIPESWDKYNTDLGDGLVVGEADKELVDGFLKAAHADNLTQSEVSKALKAYYSMATERNAEIIKTAEEHRDQVKAELQKEWGAQFTANINLIETHLEKSLGREELLNLKNAVLPDGKLLYNNPKLLNFFLNEAKSNSQSHTMTPNPAQEFTSLTEEKENIEKLFKQNPNLVYSDANISKRYSEIMTQLAKK